MEPRESLVRFFLLKTEPSEYSFDDLLREGLTKWDGVKNPLAQKHIGSMEVNDVCFIYHTGNEKSIVGIAKVKSSPYCVDGFWVVDISPEGRFKKNIPLKELKSREEFRESLLVRMPRLSVIALTKEQARLVLLLGDGDLSLLNEG
ncbi:MAG: EVE domain-containing protein [Aquificaceae bacterium]|nr:EVE domain-containing protein [Aquificaceae bacterium]MDW8237873.1 EVE domain-containing protein [Aquificaceae bacterium]